MYSLIVRLRIAAATFEINLAMGYLLGSRTRERCIVLYSTPLLYHAPMACSLAARIAAAEAEVELELAYVDLATKQLSDGSSFLTVSPLGQVSVLRLPDGQLLSETSTVLVWLQSNATRADRRMAAGSDDFFQMHRWISFCATELHKQLFRVLFYPEATQEVKERIRALAPERFAVLDRHLTGRAFLVGQDFSAADAYLIWALQLMNRAQLDPSVHPALWDYQQRLSERPKVHAMIASDEIKSDEIKSDLQRKTTNKV